MKIVNLVRGALAGCLLCPSAAQAQGTEGTEPEGVDGGSECGEAWHCQGISGAAGASVWNDSELSEQDFDVLMGATETDSGDPNSNDGGCDCQAVPGTREVAVGWIATMVMFLSMRRKRAP